MVRRRSPSNSPRSPMRRLLLRMSPIMLPKRRHTVRRIMAMVHIIRQRTVNQLSHLIKNSPALHRRTLRLRPTSRISHHTTKQPANQPRAMAQASHTTTRRSPSNSQPSLLSSRQLRHPNQPTNPVRTLAQTHHSMRAPTQALVSSLPHSPTSHNRAATMARPIPTHSSHSARLPWLLPAQTLVQQASQTPPSRWITSTRLRPSPSQCR